MNRMERFSAWRARNVLPLDVLGTLAIALFMVGLAASTGNTPGILFAHDPTSQMVWSLVSLVPVMFRRWHPQAAALCYAGLVALHLIFGPAMLYSDFLSLVMVYSVIVYGDPRNTKAFIVLASAFGLFATMAITWSVDVGPMFGQVWDGYRHMYYGACVTLYQEGFSGECASTLLTEGFQMGLLVAACLGATIVLAYWQRARQATIRMLRERNEAIATRQDEERHIAALAERARIARDMHDVVAHTLSIIIVQSDGGRYAGVGNPEVARSTMETIRRESERALHDMKRLLGVFGGSSHADYDDIAALVDQARETSPDTAIVRRVEGTAAPQRLGAQASMAVYRVVQEALTNVRKYAGPRPTVRIDERWDDGGLSLTIADNGRGASSGLDGHAPGYGLIGMRERMQAVGGTVSAGPGIGGGFVVSVTVPYAVAADAVPATADDATARSAGIATVPIQTAVSPSAVVPGTGPAPSPDGRDRTATPTLAGAATMHAGGNADATDAAFSRVSAGTVDSAVSTGTTGTTDRPTPSPPPNSRMPRLPRFAMPSFPLPERIVPPSLQEIAGKLRSKPIDQAESAGGERFNWIERLSQWSERHYLMMDVIGAVLLILMASSDLFIHADFVGSPLPDHGPYVFITVMVIGPLAFHRRFPEGTAAFLAVFCAFEMVFLPSAPWCNILVLYALHAAAAYGRPRAWMWLTAASLVDSVLFGVKVCANMMGLNTIYDLVFEPLPLRLTLYVAAGLMAGGVVFLLCCTAIVYGRWTRARGANVLILQAREEALRAEEAKQRVLAANMERDRISASIQAEVTATLTTVIDQAVDGLAMLDDCAARGETPAPETIAAAFEAIGSRGRDALAHMRQLLRVLRETGFSDEHRPAAQETMRLTPAASLDDQLRAATARA
ncbi:sensor histidine kinase [Bifidobacterium pullorum subsp. gallinarum]|uniref:histidine kinase n=1 Tax=Bifidobacterium pullorum subsp. gallinarum TaxID=78344 RepID=A0A4P6DXX1_9BIFI|nr:histidine kinase [Bifidobacterium pullorum]QAY32698.1 sensor histidine kinase [Bifidobacterium pullorum subsp. gallinarum]